MKSILIAILFAVYLSLSFGEETNTPALAKPSPEIMRVDQALEKRDLIKNKSVVIVGYFGTASFQNEYLVLNQKSFEIIFDRSVQSIQLKNGPSVTSLDDMMRSGLNNLFLNELVKVKGIIRESDDGIYIEDAVISFPLLEEKMRTAKIYGLISGDGK